MVSVLYAVHRLQTIGPPVRFGTVIGGAELFYDNGYDVSGSASKCGR